MKKILSIDSNLINSKIIEQDIKEYFDLIGVEFEFFTAQNPQETLDILNHNSIDIMFIDISSTNYNGIQLLKHVKRQDIRQPKIVAVTSLRDHTFRFEALKMNVYRYIYKPYDNKEIKDVLSKCFNKNYYAKKINRTEHFINLEDIEHLEEEFESEVEQTKHELELIETFKESHKKVSAREFIELYDDIDVEELDELEMALDRVTMSILVDNSFVAALFDIKNILEEYNRFLYRFIEFSELSKVVYSILILIRDLDEENIPSEALVSKIIITTIQDLVDWKESVFVDQSSEDIYYINDAILNSYVQLQDLLS